MPGSGDGATIEGSGAEEDFENKLERTSTPPISFLVDKFAAVRSRSGDDDGDCVAKLEVEKREDEESATGVSRICDANSSYQDDEEEGYASDGESDNDEGYDDSDVDTFLEDEELEKKHGSTSKDSWEMRDAQDREQQVELEIDMSKVERTSLLQEVLEEDLKDNVGNEASTPRRLKRMHGARMRAEDLQSLTSREDDCEVCNYDDLSFASKIFYILFSSRDKLHRKLENERRREIRAQRTFQQMCRNRREKKRRTLYWERVRPGYRPKISLYELLRARYPFYSPSFARDYQGIVLMLIIAAILYGVDYYKTSTFILDDPSINHPLHRDITWFSSILAVVPYILLYFNFFHDRETMHAVALATAGSVTTIFMVGLMMSGTWGSLSPDFLARCGPQCLENVTWMRTNNSYKVAQCGYSDPRLSDDHTILICPLRHLSLEEACGGLAKGMPLHANDYCVGPVNHYADFYALAKGYRGGVSNSLAIIVAVCYIFAVVIFRRRGWVYGSLAMVYAACSVCAVWGLLLAYGKHDQVACILSMVMGLLFAISISNLYFDPHTGIARRRPPFTLHFVNWWRGDEDSSESESEIFDSASEFGDSEYSEHDGDTADDQNKNDDDDDEDDEEDEEDDVEKAFERTLSSPTEESHINSVHSAPASLLHDGEETPGSLDGSLVETRRKFASRLQPVKPIKGNELALEAGLFDHAPRTPQNENRYYSMVRERELEHQRKERLKHGSEIIRQQKQRVRERSMDTVSSFIPSIATKPRQSSSIPTTHPSSTTMRRRRIQPRAYWDPDYKTKIRADGFSYTYMFRRMLGRELTALQDVRPAHIIVLGALAVMYFLFLRVYGRTTNSVMWIALTLELSLYPIYESFAIHSIIWRSDMSVSGWATLLGLGTSLAVWVGSTIKAHSDGIEEESPRYWVTFLSAYIGAKSTYIVTHVLVSLLLWYRLEHDGNMFRISLRPGLATSVPFKFLLMIPALAFTTLALLIVLCFYTYQYLELKNQFVQYAAVIMVAIVDATTRVWLTALLTKGIVAVLNEADEIQAYLFAIRTVKIGFALVQGFSMARLNSFGAFILANITNNMVEIGMLFLSAFRRHHPRAPHIRVHIANALGLPGWQMFPQKTRLETALLIRTQEAAELLAVSFGPIISQIPLYLDNGSRLGIEALPWWQVVIRTAFMVCVIEIPVDLLKNWMSTRVFGLDTFHVRPQVLDTYAICYMAIMSLLGFLSVLVGHELYILWEIIFD